MDSPAIDPLSVKANSEQIVLNAGGRICDWLPILERENPRFQNDLIGRALVLNALLNIAYQAPISIIRDWIDQNNLAAFLSPAERDLLGKANEDLIEQDMTDLYWSIEALYALMWGGLFSELPIDQPVPDTMAGLALNLQQNEDGSKFIQRMKLRPYTKLYQMLDLYFRAHWYARDGSLKGYSTGNFSMDVITERRKALEWLLDSESEWDDMSLNT